MATTDMPPLYIPIETPKTAEERILEHLETSFPGVAFYNDETMLSRTQERDKSVACAWLWYALFVQKKGRVVLVAEDEAELERFKFRDVSRFNRDINRIVPGRLDLWLRADEHATGPAVTLVTRRARGTRETCAGADAVCFDFHLADAAQFDIDIDRQCVLHHLEV